MPFKVRSESKELMVLRSLDARSDLPPNLKLYYLNLKKGYDGEVKFDKYTACLDNKFYILNDLLLKSNNTTFQIDSLIITKDTLLPCDVKNFEDNYVYQDDHFCNPSSKKEIQNPLHQLNRCEILLSQYLQKYGLQFPVEGKVIFINPKFFLYQAPLNKPIIFHSQLNSFIKELAARPSALDGRHLKIAELLLSDHIANHSFSQLPQYSFEQLRKGIICACCGSFLLCAGRKYIVCEACGYKDSIESAVIRNVEEIRLLFPEMKLTTNLVHEWCKVVHSKSTIRKILKSNFETKGYGKWFCYE